MAQPQPPTFANVLTNVLRFTQNQAETLINEGYDATSELVYWSYDDIKEWCVNKTKLPVNRGGCPYGDPRIRNLQAFAFWATDMHRRGSVADLASFDANMLLDYKEMVRVERAKKASDTTVPLPSELDSKADWEDWELALLNHLQSKGGINGIPLSYVIRPDIRPPADAAATAQEVRAQDLIFNAPLEGPAYTTDSEAVFSIIECLTIGQDSANWISQRSRRARDGRQAMNDLKSHFDGGEEKYKRNQAAISTLEHLHYKHEKMMSFHLFSTKLKKCFDTIELCDQGYSEANKIDILLKKIKSNSQDLRNVVTIIRSDGRKFDTFMKATQELAKHVAHLFPPEATSNSSGHRRKRGISSTKSSTGYKVVKKDGKEFVSGVDVTDQTRTFTGKEWAKLPLAYKKDVLFKNPARNKKAKTGRSASAATTTSDSASLADGDVARIINGVMRGHANMQLPPPASSTAPPRQPRMGAGAGAPARSASAATSSGSSVVSTITADTRWDHNGNIIEE